MAKTRKMLAAPLNLLSEHFAPTTDVGRKKLRKLLATAEATIGALKTEKEKLLSDLVTAGEQLRKQNIEARDKQKALDEALAQLAEKKE